MCFAALKSYNFVISIPFVSSVDCVWHSWTPWSECTAECGGGIRTRTRGKTEEEHGGEPCTGSGSETEMCNEEECPGIVAKGYTNKLNLYGNQYDLHRCRRECKALPK